MRAPADNRRNRRGPTARAVLASGAVISLAALTGGVAPAFAEPGTAPTTTTAAPRPSAPRPAAEIPADPTTPAPVETPTATSVVVAPSSTVSTQVTASSASAVAPTSDTPTPTAVSEPPSQIPAPREAPSVGAPTQVQSVAPTPTRTLPPATAETPVPSSSTATPASTTTALVAPTSPEPSVPAADAPSSSSGRTQDARASSAPIQSAGPPLPATSSSPSTSSSGSTPERVIQKVAPQTLQAPDADVQVAQTAKVVEVDPVAAPKQEIDDVSRLIDLSGRDRDGVRPASDDRRDDYWDRHVRQWRPEWIQYDTYYRPVFSNPYRDPVRIVYVYMNAPRVVWIPPLGRIVLQAPRYAPYSFTALVPNAVNRGVDVAVGSFFGGGYLPGVGMPPPLPPPPLVNYANVPVQVRYSNATYEPFRVAKIVDVGDDPQYGGRKVLLDGNTPAWGQWTQTPSGERSFEVHATQQFPGLDDPREGPLPGDYQLTLASEDASSPMTTRDVYLTAVAVTCGALSIGAVALSVLIGRRRRS